MMNLEGKKVIILGGSSGIGLATAKKAAEKRASIIIVSSNQQKINAALEELPPGTQGFAVDLSQEENIRNLFYQTGNYDHLVYCAGENLSLSTIDTTRITEARDFFTIRFWGPFAAVKYGAPFLNKGGSISLISGTASLRPGSGWSVASSICGAIEGFVRAMAVELAPVRVNCVVPGVVRTPLWNSMPEADRANLYQQVSDSVLLKRVAEAEDIARGFIYLMEQDHSTGQSLVIDGGSVLV
jgi:NAD(P)-dependent dehydrogenase (short-subunit alcohol dehydrogenase family)